ncbi:MAG: AbrB family transcriptional regulator [Arenibacterium sp.]
MLSKTTLLPTLLTLIIGAAGAALATLLAIPAAVLVGPALFLSLAGLAGLKLAIDPRLRDLAFVVLGLGIGSAFDPNAGAAILRWPLAMLVLGVSLWVSMLLCTQVLRRVFRFDAASATLAATPGHLSFVMSIATSENKDVAQIGLVQSIRLLALTLIVPLAALIMGFPFSAVVSVGGAPMPFLILVLLALAGAAVGVVLQALKLPAPLLLGGMVVSGASHVTGFVPGSVPPALLVPAFLVLGGLIGTRFSGISWGQFRNASGAGVAVTLIASFIAALAALPIAWALEMPLVTVLAAFAPGGVETMIALGAALGFDPSFVAACHIMRLVILTFLIPIAFARV